MWLNSQCEMIYDHHHLFIAFLLLRIDYVIELAMRNDLWSSSSSLFIAFLLPVRKQSWRNGSCWNTVHWLVFCGNAEHVEVFFLDVVRERIRRACTGACSDCNKVRVFNVIQRLIGSFRSFSPALSRAKVSTVGEPPNIHNFHGLPTAHPDLPSPFASRLHTQPYVLVCTVVRKVRHNK